MRAARPARAPRACVLQASGSTVPVLENFPVPWCRVSLFPNPDPPGLLDPETPADRRPAGLAWAAAPFRIAGRGGRVRFWGCCDYVFSVSGLDRQCDICLTMCRNCRQSVSDAGPAGVVEIGEIP